MRADFKIGRCNSDNPMCGSIAGCKLQQLSIPMDTGFEADRTRQLRSKVLIEREYLFRLHLWNQTWDTLLALRGHVNFGINTRIFLKAGRILFLFPKWPFIRIILNFVIALKRSFFTEATKLWNKKGDYHLDPILNQLVKCFFRFLNH